MSKILALITSGIVSNLVLGRIEDFLGALDVTGVLPRPGIGWSYADGTFTAPAVIAAVPVRRVTRLAFRNRFTQAELVALEMAALDVPTATPVDRQKSASLRVMNTNLSTATYIDLTRPDTRGGVQQLQATGLLAAGRAAQILDAPVTPEEAYVGP